MENMKALIKMLAPAVFITVCGVVGIKKCIYTVDGGHRAIKFSRFVGIRPTAYREGWHLMLPYFERPIIYDVRTHPKVINSKTGSKDLQMVDITVRVLYRPMSDKLPELYRFVGKDYDERVLPSVVNEVVKTVVAQYNATQLLSQREQVSFSIRKSLEERARDFFIVMDDVSIVHLTFSDEFNAAAESKQSAQQDAERAKFLVEQALQDKKSTIIRAQGEAISAELIGKSMNPAYIELKRIEAARRIAETLSTSRNRAFLDSDTLMLNLARPMNQKLAKLDERKI